MNEQENVQTVRSMYEAFERGDIETILNSITEDVDWRLAGPREIPWAGDYRGRAQVREFFGAHNGNVDLSRFSVDRYIAQDDTVVVLGSEAGRAARTGKQFDAGWAMVFTFRDGRVAQWRAYVDTAEIAQAFRG